MCLADPKGNFFNWHEIKLIQVNLQLLANQEFHQQVFASDPLNAILYIWVQYMHVIYIYICVLFYEPILQIFQNVQLNVALLGTFLAI